MLKIVNKKCANIANLASRDCQALSLDILIIVKPLIMEKQAKTFRKHGLKFKKSANVVTVVCNGR